MSNEIFFHTWFAALLCFISISSTPSSRTRLATAAYFIWLHTFSQINSVWSGSRLVNKPRLLGVIARKSGVISLQPLLRLQRTWEKPRREEFQLAASARWLRCKQANGSWTSSPFSTAENYLTMKAAAADCSHVKLRFFYRFSLFFSICHPSHFVTLLLSVYILSNYCLFLSLSASTSASVTRQIVFAGNSQCLLRSAAYCTRWCGFAILDRIISARETYLNVNSRCFSGIDHQPAWCYLFCVFMQQIQSISWAEGDLNKHW